MSSEFKFIKSIEWCTKLPAEGCPQESPVFLLKGSECLFRFVLEKHIASWYYNMYVEVKSGGSKWEPCYINISVGFKNEENFTLGQKKYKISDYGAKGIWDMKKDSLRSKLPSDYMDGNWIKYRINFEDVDEHLLEAKKAMDGKYVQTPSYIDNNFLIEDMSHAFSKLFKEGSHHDVVFTCGGQTIKAHKSVLCCRSDVFASMLQSDMVEGKTGKVNIQDMEPTNFKQFLKCLYTGSLPELTFDTAVRFYEAGDKYNVGPLKKQCAEFLIDNLSPDNVYDILILADRHSDAEFKNNVLEFFIRENTPYMGDKWPDFSNGNSKLAMEVLNLFCQHLHPKST